MITLLTSSIGKKVSMAITGFFLITFSLVHLFGNLTLFGGQDMFNSYAYFLTKNKFVLILLEIGLAVGFLSHILISILVSIKNKSARGSVGYKNRKTFGKATIFSSNMFWTGSLILVILIYHLNHYRLAEEVKIISLNIGSEIVKAKDLYSLVVNSFQNKWNVFIYLIFVFLLGGHISHGLQSSFRSMGFYQKKYGSLLQKISIFIGFFVIGLGFSTIPIYFGFVFEYLNKN